MKKGWSEVALSEVMAKSEDTIQVLSDQSYPNLGIYGRGRGSFTKPLISGSATRAELLFRLRAGQFIYSRLFAFEGAYALVQSSQDGYFVSNEFPAFDLNQARLLPGFLFAYFRRPTVWEALASQSTGLGNRRQRIHPEVILSHRIPLPPLAEQQRIVAHLDAIEARLTRAQKLREELHLEIEAFTTSLHLALAGRRVVRLSQLLRLDEEQTAVTPDGSYPQIGIRSFGLGLFKKTAISGSDTTYRAFNVLRRGMFVMSQVKGWEGALGVADADMDGWFASPEYRTFTCIPGECDSSYLSHLVGTTWFRKQLASATRGVGARRERVRPEMLLGLEIPFPQCNQQKRAAGMLRKLKTGKALSFQAETRKDALLPSLLDRIFNEGHSP